MKSFHEKMAEYKNQLKKGDIQQAYQGLMAYFRNLRTHFKNKYPDYFVSSNIYYGYMDITYFSFFPESIKRRNLKIALVFNHGAFRFEVWLAAVNKNVQTEYWKLIKESGWKKYHIASSTSGIDYILDAILVESPEFADLDALTKQIETGTMQFIKDVEDFLSRH